MSIIILITATAKYGEYATDSSCANRVRLSVLGRRVHSAYGSEYANSRDAIGRRHRVAKHPEPTLPDDRGRSDVSFLSASMNASSSFTNKLLRSPSPSHC